MAEGSHHRSTAVAGKTALLLAVAIFLLSHSSCDAQDGGGGSNTVFFDPTTYTAMEVNALSSAMVTVRRNFALGACSVTVNVVNNTQKGFLTTSYSDIFGVSATTLTISLHLVDDADPEPDQTIEISLSTPTCPGLALGTPSKAYVTILANDDPFGVLAFRSPTTKTVAEPASGMTSVTFTVGRTRGLFNTVGALWTVTSAAPLDSISPLSGSVSFAPNATSDVVTVNVLADNVPDVDQTFTITLASPTGGAVLGTAVTAAVTVPRNDAPVIFSTLTTTATEGSNAVLTIIRGRDDLGNSYGDISAAATVQYRTISVPGGATGGLDFPAVTSGTATFAANSGTTTITIPITDDATAELAETFQVEIFNSSPNCVVEDPRIAVVTIPANDDPNGVISFLSAGLSIPLDEDSVTSRTANVPIQRSRGTFGSIVVHWRVEDSAGLLVTTQFQQTSGTVAIASGVASANVVLTLIDDTLPEEAQFYVLRLTNVTGGGRLAQGSEGALTASIVVQDSDNVYGIIDFAADSQQSITSVPRQVHLELVRSGGSVGSLSVTYSVVYVAPGQTIAQGTSTFLTNPPPAALFAAGVTTFSGVFDIAPGTILEVGGAVVATVNTVILTSSTPAGAPSPSSPSVGTTRNQVILAINASLANGAIGFAAASQNVRVNESAAVILQLQRQGTSGQATISWAIRGVSSSFTATDVVSTSGTVQMDDGKDTAALTIIIAADAIPELDEQFNVDITSISPSNQRVNPLANSAAVVILSNDNPGGFISFDPAGLTTITAAEGTSANVLLTRTGGTLDTRVVDVLVTNARATGTGDIGPPLKRIVFGIGDTTKSVTFLVNDDAEPELEETFNVQLSTTGISPAFAGALISPTSVTLVVPKNDDANGVFALSPKTQIILESTATTSFSRNFTVTRSGGLFGAVSAYWNITSGPTPFGADLQPVSGVVQFADQQNTATFSVASEQDQVTELAEQFTISLTSADGGARLSADPVDLSSTLLVQANDDDVFFLPPFSIDVSEDSGDVSISVRRGNQANGVAVLSYATVNGTAFAGQDFSGVSGGQVTFQDGVQTVPIVISITNDSIPERVESFTVILLSVSGDAVLNGQTTVTINILANDDTNGIIQFAPSSLSAIVPEGNVVSFMLERLGGTFNAVDVSWIISPPTGDVLGPATSGTVQFQDGSDTALLNLSVVADNLPELQESFTVTLVAVLSGGAELSTTNLVAGLTVPANDDTNGIISIPDASNSVFVDEDRPSTLPGAGSVNISVERQRGRFGTVRVAWEIAPVGTPPLRSFIGFLLAGTARSSVTTTTARPGTSGLALDFTGVGSNSLVAVPQELQFSSQTLQAGVSVVCWIRLRTPGYILSKLNSAGQVVYGLRVTAQDLTFVYLPSGGASSQSVTSPTSTTLLTDGSWHQIAISIATGEVLFYVNAVLIGRASLSGSVTDTVGTLYVGAENNLGGNAIGAVLQDLRMYQLAFSIADLRSLDMNAASSNLQPTSGYVEFVNGSSSASFSVSTIDDTLPEPEEVFIARMLYVSGGAEFDAARLTATVTVYKSDNANGLFALSASSKSRTVSEGGTVSVSVVRTLGVTGSVRVSWRVSLVGSTAAAAADFNPASGSVTFLDGETTQTISFGAVNDNIPELNELFSLFLTAVEVLNEPASRTSTSGASLDGANIEAAVTISANDDPYGVFEFSAGMPATGVTFIPASTAVPSLQLRESAGLVDIYVVRAQGTVGNATVEYTTSAGTAVGDGASPDYMPTAGTLEFANGELFKKFQLRINDDATPELAKTFMLNLTNPQGVPQSPLLGAGRVLIINLLPSDDAFGAARFNQSSLSIITDETTGSTSLTVIRIGGTLGVITVSWMANISASGDLTPLTGNVTFPTGVASVPFSVNVINDPTPETAELFYISLVAVYGGGRLSSTGGTVATITIESSDDPHGAFQFTPGSQGYKVPELSGAVATLTVERLFGSVGTVELNYTTALDTSAAANLRALPTVDFAPTSGVLRFGDNETVKTLDVTILVDTRPEVDETFLVVLGGVRLLSAPSTPPAKSSPRLASPGFTAVVTINSNDDAFGVVEFGSAALRVTEPAVPPVITIFRRAGSFGDIMVTWSASGGTASENLDFFPLIRTQTMPENDTSINVPITIEDDTIPEFDETFTITITSVAGGARIGPVSSAVVTIAANDDPNGAFGFTSSSSAQMFTEPSGSSTTPVTLEVERTGGTVGVVAVSYTVAMADGSSATADITPVSGQVHFTSGDTSETMMLTIQPDILPEIDEVIQVRLVSALLSSGQSVRIRSDANVANITIFANDRPHGIVQFSPTTSYTTSESSSNRILSLSVFRSEGTFGDLRVTYQTRALGLSDVAAATGQTSLSFFTVSADQCVSGVAEAVSGSNVSHCTNLCLSRVDCLAFCFLADSSCRLFTSVAGTIALFGATLYTPSSRTSLLRAQAQASLDFQLVTGSSVIIPAGQRHGNVSVTILADSQPELDEYFGVDLQSVSLVSGPAAMSVNEPSLGASRSATVDIQGNDAANGVFVIYATNNDAQSIRIGEQPNFALSMTVERLFGSIGSVTIQYSAVNGTAVAGADFSVPTTDFFFADGVSRRSFFIQLKEDLIPEPDESFQVVLSSPTGGASVAASPNNSVTVIIADNDLAAGRVAIAQSSLSAVVNEGDSFSLTVQRTVASFGTVRSYWRMSSLDSNVSEEFTTTSGYVVFGPGQTSATIPLSARVDVTPEIAAVFNLTLFNISTSGISSSPPLGGAAVLDATRVTSIITLRASNMPHGQVAFSPGSLVKTVSEVDANVNVTMTIVREFGTIGDIIVFYEGVDVNGSQTTVSPRQSMAASPGEDFDDSNHSVTILDGDMTATIYVTVLADSVSELTEIFLVNLTGVVLVPDGSGAPPNLTFLPTIAEPRSATISIPANDGTNGQLQFDSSSAVVSVNEDAGFVNLTVERTLGLFGEVQVFFFAMAEAATPGSVDFVLPTNRVLVFKNGVASQTISIAIVADQFPEINERFNVTLASESGGATLGAQSVATVTINANDNANGLIDFAAAVQSVTLQEPVPGNTSGSAVSLVIQRTAGLFGEVQVPFSVQAAGRMDLSPTSGIVTFLSGDDQKTLTISAVIDTIPELMETYSVVLQSPSGGASLGPRTSVNITVRENSDPYGVMQLFFANDASAKSINVEEDVGVIPLAVRRSQGSFGAISVQWNVVSGSATSVGGDTLNIDNVQTIKTSNIRSWHSFKTGSTNYVLAASGSISTSPVPVPTGAPVALPSSDSAESALYYWDGQWLKLQSIASNGARAWTSWLTDGGDRLFVVANYGQAGRTQVMSQIFQMRNGFLVEVQTIGTVGAVNVEHFSVSGEDYLFFANKQNNANSTNVDSTLYRLTAMGLTLVQSIATFGATSSEMFTTSDSETVLVVTGSYDSIGVTSTGLTRVYRWVGSGFQAVQYLGTNDAQSVAHFTTGGNDYIAISNRDQTDISRSYAASLFQWNTSSDKFDAKASNLMLRDARQLNTYTQGGKLFLTAASPVTGVTAYEFNVITGNFTLAQSSSLTGALSVEPITIMTSVFNTTMLMVAREAEDQTSVLQSILTSAQTDFVQRGGVLTFKEGEMERSIGVRVLNDAVPEIDESFSIRISTPTGGSILGSQTQLSCTILTNDNAHGVLGFDQPSLATVVNETLTNRTVVLTVNRQGGTFGDINIDWTVSGDHNMGSNVDILPTSGVVTVQDGSSSATISLTVFADSVAELNEVSTITLTAITGSGGVAVGGDLQRRATLRAGSTVSVLTVLANDEPHGVVQWSPGTANVTHSEVDNANTTFTLQIVREFGLIGDLLVYYETANASSYPMDQQATADVDYVSVGSGVVEIADGASTASVSLTLLHDNTPELAETFLVNITDVRLKSEASRRNSSTASPRVSSSSSEIATVTIRENDESRGILAIDATLNANGELLVAEGTNLVISVRRGSGSFGIIGCSWRLTHLTTSLPDISGPLLGMLTWNEREDLKTISLVITDDSIPEMIERFSIELYSPTGGARLGSQSTIVVAIDKSDFANGLLGFSSQTLRVSVPEATSPSDTGAQVKLTVQRSLGTFGFVNASWAIAGAAADLSPVSGSVYFLPNETTQDIVLSSLPDIVPEGEEPFTVVLTAVSGGASLRPGFTQATVVIPANDDAFGVFSIAPTSQNVYTAEGRTVGIGLVRAGGTFRNIKVSYRIRAADSNFADDMASTFLPASGNVTFLAGVNSSTVILQVLSDPHPEEVRSYTFQLTLVDNGGQLATINTDSRISVVASHNPHGTVQLTSALLQRVSEDVGSVTFTLVRTGGSIGAVRVNYTVGGGSATIGSDYTSPAASSVVFNNTSITQQITIPIVNDAIPELTEDFFVVLTSIDFIGGTLNTTVLPGGFAVDIAPSLGPAVRAQVDILENDDAHGAIEFELASTRLDLHEGVGVYRLQLVRSGGTFGGVSVQYTAINLTAHANGIDFGSQVSPSTGVVLFAANQSRASLDLVIIDDNVAELQERFQIRLENPTNGARLGTPILSTVTISSSDDPSGIFGFTASTLLGFTVDNPSPASGSSSIRLSIYRTAGLFGNITVFFDVFGSDPSRIHTDILPTLGSVTFVQGQQSGTFDLSIVADSTPELEEVFVVRLTSLSGGGRFNMSNVNSTITILPHNNPHGVVFFSGDSLNLRNVQEPSGGGAAKLSFPLTRADGLFGDVMVAWQVTGTNLADIKTPSGVATIADGVSTGSFLVEVQPDAVPELQQNFSVKLSSPTGGALLGASVYSNFSVLANDGPHGSFQLVPGSQAVVVDQALVNAGVVTGRYLTLQVLRELGLFGNVTVTINITFSETPSHSPVFYRHTFIAPAGQRMVSTTIPISAGFFFQSSSSFVLALTSVSISAGAVGNPPVIGVNVRDMVSVPELESNSICNFAANSLQLSVDDSVTSGSSNVWATVTRQGLLGDVTISWRSVVAGSNSSHSLMPVTGSVVITNANRTMRFGAQAIASSGSQQGPVALSLQLDSISTLTVGGARLASSSLEATIEPRGVLRIAPSSQQVSVLETQGASVSLTVWRQYGAAGNVTVFYATRVIASATDKALPTSDYTPVNSSFIMYVGQTIATVQIDITNDIVPEDTEEFEVVLWAVRPTDGAATVPASPRLHSSLTSSVITITDDDDPAGVFSLAPGSTGLRLLEGQSANIVVRRDRGQFGAASVTIRTVLLTNVGANQSASTSDFIPIDTVLMFANGQSSANVTLHIVNDATPEINETFGLALSSPTGGARLSTLSNLTSTSVIIPGNDNQYGAFGFAQDYSVTVNEDTSPSAMLTVQRNAGTFGIVTVHWIARRDRTGRAGGLPEQLVAAQGDVVFQEFEQRKSFVVTLADDPNAEAATTFYIHLQTVEPATKAVLSGFIVAQINSMSNDAADGVYQFAMDSRVVVAKPGATAVDLKVTRPSGLSKSSVQCVPVLLTTTPTIYGEPATIARPGTDYIAESQLLTFDVGIKVLTCQIALLAKNPGSTDIAPSLFNVTLAMPSGLATIGELNKAEVVVTYSDNINRMADYRVIIENNPTAEDIVPVISGVGQLPNALEPGTGLVYFVALVDRVIDAAQVCTSKSNAINMMGVFDNMLASTIFTGYANYSTLITKFAFATLSCATCPSNKTFSGTYLNVAVRSRTTYSGMSFTGVAASDRPADTFSFPDIANLERFDKANRSNCYTVHFIEYLNQRWFTPALISLPVLSNKVLSVNIQGITPTAVPYDVTYRIHTSQARVTNRGGSCLFWDHTDNIWSSSSCVRQTPSSGADLQYIECKCNRLPDLAARAHTDSRVGFGIASRVSCFVCMAVMFLVLLLHHLAHRENMMVATKLFLHVLFAVMAMEIVLVASFYQASITDTEGCFALGYLIHFLGLAQFVWMAIMAYNFYRTFIFEDDETDRLYMRYVVIGWFLPAALACTYIGVTIGGLSWATSRTYGDVNNTGDICFMNDLYGALFGGVAPVVLCLAACAYFFIVMYYNTERKAKWTGFDDFYLECDNGSEIPRLVIFFTIIFLTWVFASLHIAFSKDWTEIFFVVFNFILAAYALVMYTLVRWQALRTKGTFSPEDQSYPLGQVPTSLSTSKHSLASLGSKKQLVLHRQISTVDEPGNVRPFRPSVASQQSYGDPQVEVDIGYGRAAERASMGEEDGTEFDDLMYMLKTGGSLGHDDNDGLLEAEEQYDPGLQNGGAASAEHYQMRRISIADTHL